jgi:hypothetical protein
MISDWNAPAGLGRDIFGRTILAGLVVLALFLPPLLIFLLIVASFGACLAASAGASGFAAPAVVPMPLRRLAPRAPPLL